MPFHAPLLDLAHAKERFGVIDNARATPDRKTALEGLHVVRPANQNQVELSQTIFQEAFQAGGTLFEDYFDLSRMSE